MWFKVDDGFNSHPKALAAGAAAIGLWTLAGSWSSANLTDGFVPDYVLPRLDADGPAYAEKLAAVGLWRRTRGGFLFHDWADYNPNSDDAQRKRKAARERMRNLRAQRRASSIIAGHDENGSREPPANTSRTFAARSPHVRNPDPVPESSPDGELSSSPPTRRRAEPKTSRGDPAFQEFYAAYPKHVGRKAAESAWQRALRSGGEPDAMIAGAKRYAEERAGENPQYTKHPATWLNQGCWEDDPSPPRPRADADARIVEFLRGSGGPGPPQPPGGLLPPGETR
ncbi:hypothetical protein [Amycolatopsis sp. NPDC004079]|uniref:hypothetical protein n=1 Tax=Amycolatopsis sp. NPDC004079 TaxID=3154549 RepID=UPI0033B31B67